MCKRSCKDALKKQYEVWSSYCILLDKKKKQRRPNFPGGRPPSIIGAKELNYCVRDGNRCDLLAIVTAFLIYWEYWTLKIEQHRMSSKPSGQVIDLFSINQLNTLPCLHLWPINVVVSHGSYLKRRKSHLEGGFALRCFQRLSRPYVATRLCPWQNNRCTRGMSIPVLSY